MGLNVILQHALAVTVHDAEVVLGECIILDGSFPLPLRRLDNILRHTFVGLIADSDV